MHNVKKLEIGFSCKQKDTINQSRKLLVYSTERFLNNINSNDLIRPYLNIFPFMANNVTIHIYFDNSSETPSNKIIDAVTLFSGKITYYVSEKEEVLKTIHEETYEAALKILESDKHADNRR